MKFVYIILFSAALGGAIAAKETEKTCAYSERRLPQRIKPEHYDLRLDVDTDAFEYRGSISIRLLADDTEPEEHQPARNVIVLHANTTLSIDEVGFKRGKDSAPAKVKGVCRFDYTELLVITLHEDLEHMEEGELAISFHGAISDDPDYLMGFYKNGYTKSNGEEGILVNTQFQAAAARKAFPCFDEPNFKATFDITLVHDPNLTALSNSPVEQDTIDPATKRQVTRYKRTPKMSTYLVAFVIGELEYIEEIIFEGRLQLRAYTAPGKTDQAKFALETAVRAITLMEEYFDVQFPIEKIDMVALPNFEHGAMENWGLILYWEFQFLFDHRHRLAAHKAYSSMTVVHELSHQWFGNLVTMKWWNDLWLNEGFATWMQNHLNARLFPEFEWDYTCLRELMIAGMDSDARPDTHSIQPNEVGRNVGALFDEVTYEKTGAIVKQIHDDFLGPDRFREGIRLYMKRHAYGNTEANYLWGALREASDLPVDELMKSWITQPGHPVVSVHLSEAAGKAVLLLEQERYFSSEPSEGQRRDAAGQTWMIPVSLIVSDGKGETNTIKLLMDAREKQVELPHWFDADNQRHWVKLNAGFDGFYRVRYSRDLVARLEKPCKSKALLTEDRLNLIYDLLHGVHRDILSDAELAKVFGWFQKEHEGAIVLALYDAYTKLAEAEMDPKFHLKVRRSLEKCFTQIYKRQGFKISSGEPSISDIEATFTAYRYLVAIEFAPLVRDALAEFDRNGNKTDANLRAPMYQAVARFGSEEQISRLREILEQADHADEIDRIEAALTLVDEE